MSFGRQIHEALARFGERTAISDKSGDLTYSQMLAQAGNLARNFVNRGLKSGDRVGLAMQGTLEVILAILASWRIGATPVVIDFRTPRAQRARQAADFDLAVVLESRAMPGSDHYPAEIFDQNWRFSAPRPAALADTIDCTNPAFLMFSSGTTGEPKAYVQSQEALAGRVNQRRKATNATSMRLLTPMALSYSATRHELFSHLAFGGTVRLMPPLFSPSELIEALLSFRASATSLPPAVIARMVKEAGERSTHLLPEVVSMRNAGGPALPQDKIGAYRYLTPGYSFAYASSLTGVLANLAGEDILTHTESTGRPLYGNRFDILDPEGNVLPVGETGRIKAWSKTMVSAVLLPGNRLYVDPQVMGPDWGMTGDIGFLDAEGFLTIVDREADVIVRGGVNVHPGEIERLVRTHPKVRDVAVAGLPDKVMGQEIAAFIVSDNGTVDEFRDFLRTALAPDRRPRVIRLMPSLPYNANGKLLRRQLVEDMLKDQPG